MSEDSKVFIAAKEIGAAEAAPIGKYHAYLVYDENGDETTLGDQKVIRGGPQNEGLDPGFIRLQIDYKMTESFDRLLSGENVANRHYTVLAEGAAADTLWSSMTSFATTMGVTIADSNGLITTTSVDYFLLGPNSNSVINSILSASNIDFRDVAAQTVDITPTDYPGDTTILDGSGNNNFRAFSSGNFYAFYDSYGNDTITVEHGARLEILKDADAASTNHVVMLDQQLSLLTLLSPFGTDDLEVMQDNSGLSPVTLPLVLNDQYGANGFAADTLEFRGDDDLLLHRINLALVPEDEATGSVSTFYTAFSDEADVTAGVGSDHVYGDTAANTLTGGRGSDTLRGNDGQDLYLWNLGDSNDRIIDDWADGDTLDLGAGVSNGWVTASTSGSDLLLNIADISGYGATLRIIGQAANAASFITSHVSGLVEEAAPATSGAALWGTEVWHPELTPPANVWEDLNDTVPGTGGNESLEGRTGNDYLSGGAGDDKLDGGEGENVIHLGAGASAVNPFYGLLLAA